MQAIDDRESRLRDSFGRLEDDDGRISREAIIDLVTVGHTIIPKSQWSWMKSICRPAERCSWPLLRLMTCAAGSHRTERADLRRRILSVCSHNKHRIIGLWVVYISVGSQAILVYKNLQTNFFLKWWFLINHWSPISKNSLKQSVYCVYCIYYLGGTHFPLQALINNFLAIHGAAISQYVFKHVGCVHEVVYLLQGILLSKLKGKTWLNPKPETTQTYLK